MIDALGMSFLPLIVPVAQAADIDTGKARAARTRVTFPEDYQDTLAKCHTIDFPATDQVRYHFANKSALQAAILIGAESLPRLSLSRARHCGAQSW